MKKFLLLLLITFPFVFFGQSVATDAATNVSYTSATINGTFTDCNGGWLFNASFNYDEDGSAPWTNNEASTPNSSNVNGTTASYDLTGLSPGTTYYFQFTAFDGSTTYTGSVLSFTTLSPSAPTVTTGTVFTGITNQYAENSNNEVVSDNGSALDERGIVYSSTNSNPVITDNCKKNGSSVGTYSGFLSGLTQATKYYARAYATNPIGTGYGSTVRTFTTEPSTYSVIDSMVSNATDELTVYFDEGSADEVVIFMRETNQVSDYPADGSSYTGNSVFGSGDNLGNNTYVIYAGSGAKGSVTVTGIDETKDYYVDISDGAESGADRVYFDDIDQLNTADDSNLPIELVYFKGQNSDNKNILEWATASEENNHYFIIESSTDMKSYTKVGEILGSGDSKTLKTYSIEDNNANGKTYYRLTQVDYDGKTETFSPIVVDNYSNEIAIENAFVDGDNLNIELKTITNNARVSVYSINGQLLFEKRINTAGYNTINFAADYSTSAVIIKLKDGDRYTAKKIVL